MVNIDSFLYVYYNTFEKIKFKITQMLQVFSDKSLLDAETWLAHSDPSDSHQK